MSSFNTVISGNGIHIRNTPYPLWVLSHLGGLPCGCSPKWALSHVGAFLCGRSPMWVLSQVGALPCGRSPIWAFPSGSDFPNWDPLEKKELRSEKYTQMRKRNSDGKIQPRWERVFAGSPNLIRDENLPITSSEVRARKGEAGLHISLERSESLTRWG